MDEIVGTALEIYPDKTKLMRFTHKKIGTVSDILIEEEKIQFVTKHFFFFFFFFFLMTLLA